MNTAGLLHETYSDDIDQIAMSPRSGWGHMFFFLKTLFLCVNKFQPVDMTQRTVELRWNPEMECWNPERRNQSLYTL